MNLVFAIASAIKYQWKYPIAGEAETDYIVLAGQRIKWRADNKFC
jgi:hypothetical protein